MLVGLYALLSGVLRLGFIGDLLSRPVLIGYMTGVAVIMIASQLGKVTGVDVAGDSFLQDPLLRRHTARDGVSWPTLAIGLGVAGLLLLLTPRYPRSRCPLIVMLLATAVVAIFDLTAVRRDHRGRACRSSGTTSGCPRSRRPTWGSCCCPRSASSSSATPTTSSPRAPSRPDGSRVHNNQEFLAMGTANLGSSLVGGFPVSSSASRTAIAEASGARSQLYSLVAAALTIVSVLAFSA